MEDRMGLKWFSGRFRDKTVKVLTSVLGQLLPIKLGAYEAALEVKINALRWHETEALGKFMYYIAVAGTLSGIGGCVSFFVTLTTLFTIVSSLNNPLNLIGQQLPTLFAAFTSLGRIQGFLPLPEKPKPEDLEAAIDAYVDDDRANSDAGAKASSIEVSVIGCTFVWEDKINVLTDITLKLVPHELHMVVGLVASITLASQTPFIYPGTLCANILLDSTHDETFYHQGIHACGLCQDIETLPCRDMTKLGDKGEAAHDQVLAKEDATAATVVEEEQNELYWAHEQTSRRSAYTFYIKCTGVAMACGLVCSHRRVEWARDFSMWLMLPHFGYSLSTRTVPNIHKVKLAGVMWSPISWITKNPVGKILNQSAPRLFAMDGGRTELKSGNSAQEFSFAFSNFAMAILGQVGTIVFVTIATPLLALALPFLVVLGAYFLRFYLATSKQFRRLESASKSPVCFARCCTGQRSLSPQLYTLFGTTVSGLITVRAYRAQNFFRSQNATLVDRTQEARMDVILRRSILVGDRDVKTGVFLPIPSDLFAELATQVRCEEVSSGAIIDGVPGLASDPGGRIASLVLHTGEKLRKIS
ncbi:hypothetical protein DFH08DRAFT_1000586 [Mycena albidolilacea]|uniref:ABC transmembrane type-1 domain-containing protein n=1 Tax=Mycena albidolilacea TaxID=1033008 RepID=A0AAD7ERN2_9AGAR|nr:hypothetical protein DFH08DRAFT_1000586 [Mycena albidolilacea]